jgi:ribosomal protein S18 acetylase RimI-like enzyme
MVIEEGGLLGAVEPTGARSLNVDDLEQILPLVQLTAPGPFLPGTIDLGRYYGCFEGEQLIAMAGERLHVQGYTEISAVCTRPEARGRGLASALTSRVARGILERGETPFLHLRSDNDSARRVYERLGFRRRRAVDIWVVTSPSSRPERERRP